MLDHSKMGECRAMKRHGEAHVGRLIAQERFREPDRSSHNARTGMLAKDVSATIGRGPTVAPETGGCREASVEMLSSQSDCAQCPPLSTIALTIRVNRIGFFNPHSFLYSWLDFHVFHILISQKHADLGKGVPRKHVSMNPGNSSFSLINTDRPVSPFQSVSIQAGAEQLTTTYGS